MPVVKELLRGEKNGAISFGDYTLTEKAKLDNFEHGGDVYKVKTFHEITKLEKNGLFVYESVPGSAVTEFAETEDGVRFQVESGQDVQITLELEESTEYGIYVNGTQVGMMETNRSGKLSISVEPDGKAASVKVMKR